MSTPNENSNPQPSERLLRLIASVQECKGQWIDAEWNSTPTPKAASKKAGITLRKNTVAVVRTGVQFANLATVKEGIASGERGEVGELPWGAKWLVYPFGMVHPNGKEYFRFTLGSNTRPAVRYFVTENGTETEVNRDTFLSHLPPSAAKPKEPSEVISVSLDNIVRIG